MRSLRAFSVARHIQVSGVAFVVKRAGSPEHQPDRTNTAGFLIINPITMGT
jgi:hypothetical protein